MTSANAPIGGANPPLERRHRIVFMGTADFATPSLDALAAAPWADVVSVVTQPARPAGRGRSVQPTPIQIAAERLRLPVWTPERLRRAAAVARLRELAPDLCVVAAYGQILSPAVLAVPRMGSLNVHASLLPRHRGAAPVAGALLAGDKETGVTIMAMDEGLDTGPIIAQARTPIEPGETVGALTDRLARLGATLLAETTPAWMDGQLIPTPQDDAQSTMTRPIAKDAGRIDWRQSATHIERMVRAYTPWPGASAEVVDQGRILIRAARAWPEIHSAPPGQGNRVDAHLIVGCGAGALEPLVVQPAGRGPMAYADYLRGRRLPPEGIAFIVTNATIAR